MILSHQAKFIFIKPKKVAGSSVELYLSKFCGPDDIITPLSPGEEDHRLGRREQNWRLPHHRRSRLLRLIGPAFNRYTWGYEGYHQHMPAREVKRRAGDGIWNSYVTFAIERNPWDRQVSMYHWHYRNKPDRPSFDRFVTDSGLRKTMKNFEIYEIDGKVGVDFVCRYDRLDQDLAEVLGRCGITDEGGLPRAKGKFRPKEKHWRDYYTDETRAIIADLYAREIEAFGFSFDD